MSTVCWGSPCSVDELRGGISPKVPPLSTGNPPCVLPGTPSLTNPPPLPDTFEALPSRESASAVTVLVGRVRERGSGKPLAGLVQIAGRTLQVGEDGRFSLTLPPGTYVLDVLVDDHVPRQARETLAPWTRSEVDYYVDRYTWANEYIVYGQASDPEVTRVVVSAEELRRVPGAFGDPLRSLQAMPGVARSNGLEGALAIRGAETINTATYIDEMPVPYLFHFFIGRSVVNPLLLEDIEFYPGGMPTRFGDATQAVVNARLHSESTSGVHGQVSADIFDFSTAMRGSFGEWDWQAAGRYSWVGGLIGIGSRIQATSQGLDGDSATWAYPRYFDYSTHIGRDVGPHRVEVTALGSRDAFTLRIPEDQTPEADDELPFDPNLLMDSYFHRFRARWSTQTPTRNQQTWLMGGLHQQSSLLDGLGLLSDGIERGKLEAWTLMGRHDHELSLNSWTQLRLGGLFSVQPVRVIDYADALTTDGESESEDIPVHASAWIESGWDLGKWTLTPGMRGSLNAFNDEVHIEAEPRISARYTLSPRWSLTAFVGRFTQIPPAERYAASLGNPDLTLMTSWQSSVGVEGRWPSGLEVSATVYGTSFTDLPVKGEEVVVERAPLDMASSDDGMAYSIVQPAFEAVDGYAFGIDTMVRMRPNRTWFGWMSLSLSRSLRRDTDGIHPGDHDQPFAWTTMAAWNAPRDWSLSSRFQLTSGHPYTPLSPAYNVQYDYWQGYPGATNSGRYPIFWQIDIRIDKTFTARRARWTLYLDIFNVTNNNNPLFLSYNPNFSDTVPLVWVPILPNLGLEVAF